MKTIPVSESILETISSAEGNAFFTLTPNLESSSASFIDVPYASEVMTMFLPDFRALRYIEDIDAIPLLKQRESSEPSSLLITFSRAITVGFSSLEYLRSTPLELFLAGPRCSNIEER